MFKAVVLSRLQNSGYGCTIGHKYCGAFAYADDLSLAAPSLYALRMMSNICLDFAKEYDLEFNPNKCQLVKFGKSRNVPFQFNNCAVEYTPSAIHLGHIIGRNSHGKIVNELCCNFNRRLNSVIGNFGFCRIDTKWQLFLSYCTSFYGICLCNLQDTSIEKFYTTWRKAIRKLFGLPDHTHCNLLPSIAECMPIQVQLINRMTRFISSCLSDNNRTVQLLSQLALRGSGSNMSKSINFIMSKYRMDPLCFTSEVNMYTEKFRKAYYTEVNEKLRVETSLIRDILADLHDADFTFLSKEELQSMLFYTCTK